MPKKRKPTKFLNLKLIAKFLQDYRKMPYKSKSAIMAAILVIMLVPLALIYPLGQSTPIPLDLAPFQPVTCHITGCADQLCLDQPIDAPTDSCPVLPEFQCLTKAKCEVQPSGRCGWTETEEYSRCLSEINK